MAYTGDHLRAEYALLQGHYEAFDARALTIKSWAVPLLSAGLGVGIRDSSLGLLFATALASMCLWWLEALWKNFQYCYIERIDLLESYFRGDTLEAEIKPFQIRVSWMHAWTRWFRSPKALLERCKQPFVFLPYLPIFISAVAAGIYIACKP
ncbi:hypothetical protein [Sinorhizobium meliloti]|uniref:hypothetical protein n=1 Tax=Rhizobium meliloti TaxID=382 RepID=UPI001294C8B4|nr:hypothetical protein [Sinorhizobium meliloti]